MLWRQEALVSLACALGPAAPGPVTEEKRCWLKNFWALMVDLMGFNGDLMVIL